MEIKKIQRFFIRQVWMLLVVLLPVTSFPIIVRIVGSDVVGLPSGVILGLIVLVWYIPILLKNDAMPIQSLPLILFVLAAIFSTCLAVFLVIPPYKNGSIMREGITSLLTLMIGFFMFLVTARFTQKPGYLQWTFRLLNYSGAFIVLWSLAQAGVWRVLQGYPQIMETFHRFFSTGVLYKDRVTGLALEPSWFAHQLNMLYLPLWFSATITRYSAHRRRFLGITLENVLLVFGVVSLFLSLSRVGYLSFLMMLVVFFFQINGKMVDQLAGWIVKQSRKRKKEKTDSLKHIQQYRFWLCFGLTVFFIGVYIAVLSVGLLALSRLDQRMATLFQFNFTQDHWLYRYLGKLDLGPRVSFWLGGWNVFLAHPLFGVGLGNSGFFFMDALPAYAWSFTEVRSLMLHGSSVMNTKNLWTRLLAETGLVGLSLFLAWLFSLWKTARELTKKSSPLLKQMGLMGIFVIAALFIEGFSVDSFALPYYWFSFGLVVSAFYQAQETTDRLQSSSL